MAVDTIPSNVNPVPYCSTASNW